jgi:hypothetical protein
MPVPSPHCENDQAARSTAGTRGPRIPASVRETPLPALVHRSLHTALAPADVLRLQRAMGNRRVEALLRQQPGAVTGNAQPALQRMGLYPYQGKSNKDLHGIGGAVLAAVEHAVKAIAADPFITFQPYAAKGYLATWVKAFTEFADDPTEIPDFFFARYGYAVETIATQLLAAQDVSPYHFAFQISHGHTRPDIVIFHEADELGWVDITSEGSPNHILKKQGAGWQNRAYVAEARYDMPSPASLMKGSGKLDAQALKRLKQATQAAAERQEWLEAGRDSLAVDIAAAFRAEANKKGEGLSRTDVRQITLEVVRASLDEDAGPKLAKGALGQLGGIDVPGTDEVSTGLSWANWAFDGGSDGVGARELLTSYGRRLSR